MGEFEGKVAVITGASSGVGAATARRLHAAGAKVVIGARRGVRLKELAGELGDDRVEGVEMDVRSPAEVDELTEAAIRRFGRVDVFVANAGMGAYGGILDYGDGEVRELVETNLLGVIWSVRSVVPHLLGEGGDIVIVSSVAGVRGRADEAVYAATKHGLVGLAGSLDRELRSSGIRVVCLCPGAIATEFALDRGRSSAALDRMMTADDVAEMVATVVAQPPHLRTLMWSMRSMNSEN